MKKIIMTICLFLLGGSVVYADGSSLSIKENYKEALKYYKSKNYKQSYALLSKLYMSRLADANLNFYLGRSAYETGHYTVALAAFERVEMLEPGNLRNKLEMARTYFMLKMYQDAQNYFQEVLKHPNLPKNVRTNVEMYLAKVKKVQNKSFTYANVSLDFLYDSNVNYGSLDSTYNINVGTLPSEPERSDIAYQLYGDIANIYDFGEKNGFAVKNRFVGLLKNYRDENAYNIRYIAYSPSLLYTRRNNLMEFALGIDSLGIAKHEYLRTLSVTPRFEHSHSATFKSIAYFKYQKKEFQRASEKDLDANHYEFYYGLQDILSPRSYVQGNLIALKENKVRGTRVDVDYSEYRASFNYAKQLSAKVGMELFGEYRRRAYDDFSTLFGSTRLDNGGDVALSINTMVMNLFYLNIKGNYNRVDSNQERYSYKKYTLSCGISKTF